MRSLDADEARALLLTPLVGTDYPEWGPSPTHPQTHVLVAGVVGPNDEPTQLFVKLAIVSSESGDERYDFSLFKLELNGCTPVDQLHIVQTTKPSHHLHASPHGHLGGTRMAGNPSWLRWSFEDVLHHFCHRSKVTSLPPPQAPNDIRSNSHVSPRPPKSHRRRVGSARR